MTIANAMTGMTTERYEFLRDLGDIVEFLRDNPDVAIPAGLQAYNGEYGTYLYGDEESQKRDLAEQARALRKCSKTSSTNYLTITRTFGTLSIGVSAEHEKTCEAKVVGKKTVRKPVYGPVTYEEVEVDEVEWVCPDSLLSGTVRQ